MARPTEYTELVLSLEDKRVKEEAKRLIKESVRQEEIAKEGQALTRDMVAGLVDTQIQTALARLEVMDLNANFASGDITVVYESANLTGKDSITPSSPTPPPTPE